MDGHPVPDQRMGQGGVRPHIAVAADMDPVADDGAAAMVVPRPINASGPITAPGSTVIPSSRRALPSTLSTGAPAPFRAAFGFSASG